MDRYVPVPPPFDRTPRICPDLPSWIGGFTSLPFDTVAVVVQVSPPTRSFVQPCIKVPMPNGQLIART